MTQTQKLSEKFSNELGVDLNNQFENQVYGTIMGLIESLENRLIDNETKIDYATHVFAKALDEMVDYLESPSLLNWIVFFFILFNRLLFKNSGVYFLRLLNTNLRDSSRPSNSLSVIFWTASVISFIFYLVQSLFCSFFSLFHPVLVPFFLLLDRVIVINLTFLESHFPDS